MLNRIKKFFNNQNKHLFEIIYSSDQFENDSNFQKIELSAEENFNIYKKCYQNNKNNNEIKK
jgi:hypothetical protein